MKTIKQMLVGEVTNADMVYFSNRLSHLVEKFDRVGDTKIFANFYYPNKVQQYLIGTIESLKQLNSDRAYGGFAKNAANRRIKRMGEILTRIKDYSE